jgi:hypothetical protein
MYALSNGKKSPYNGGTALDCTDDSGWNDPISNSSAGYAVKSCKSFGRKLEMLYGMTSRLQ